MCLPHGNLAPEGSVIKSTVDRSERGRCGRRLPQHRSGEGVRERAGGDCRDQGGRRSSAGDVLVLICRGPMGAGMEETYQITSALKYLDFGKHVAVLTDARFSGVSTGACIGHVSPEALAGGPIGKLRDGDLIRIVIDRVRSKAPWTASATPGRMLDRRKEARLLLRQRARAARPGCRPGAAGRHPPVGGAAGRERRHLGRQCLRRRPHPRGAGGGQEGADS